MSNKWSFETALATFSLPFPELIYNAQTVHRTHFGSYAIQISTLLNIKTGACPENCGYCSQSGHYKTAVKKEPLMQPQEILEAAKRAKNAGSTRFCMGAAWRGPTDQALQEVCSIIAEVKKLGLETCATLGMLKEHQAHALKDAGLDYYNHNIDTSPEYYEQVVTTHTFNDRLQTLEHVRNSGMKVCCGGILSMGETNADRIKMLVILANLPTPPESVPINKLIKIPGTPMANKADIDLFDFIRTIALARIMMPKSYVRLSAGRSTMTDELQALCFLAGANSIFYGEKLLTADNPSPIEDDNLLTRLGLKKEEASITS